MRFFLKTLLIFTFLTAFQVKEKEVFICMSKSSKKYHIKKDCTGINSCKSNIKKILIKKAENVGRTLCEIEKKQLK